jgi:HlyD family secretion protein
MRLRTIVIGLGLIAAAGIATSAYRNRASAKPAAATATAERGTLSETVRVTGKVVAAREVEIKCKASGAVLRLVAEESAQVKEGDVLAELDPQDEQRTVERAELALASSRARLEQAEGSLTIAREELVSERHRAESALAAATLRQRDAADRAARAKALLDQGLVSAEEAATAAATAAEQDDSLASARLRIDDLATGERGVSLKRQDVALAEAQVKSDEVTVKDAHQRLADTRIVAPISGVVAKVNIAEGQIVSSGISTVGGGTAVMVLADTTRLEVVVQIDESDVAKIGHAQKASITSNAFPGRSWDGAVSRIAAKGAARNNTVEFETRLALAGDAATVLKPEMTATVAITTATATDAVLVPVGAVTWRKDHAFVTLDADGREVEVKTGANDGTKVEIVSGIDAGAVLRLPSGGGRSRWRTEGPLG